MTLTLEAINNEKLKRPQKLPIHSLKRGVIAAKTAKTILYSFLEIWIPWNGKSCPSLRRLSSRLPPFWHLPWLFHFYKSNSGDKTYLDVKIYGRLLFGFRLTSSHETNIFSAVKRFLICTQTNPHTQVVVVAQLVEQALLTPKVRSLILVIGKILYRIFFWLLSTVLKRRK